MKKVEEFILSKGFDFKPELNGEYQEFETETQKGWYIGESLNGKTTLTFGSWKTGEKHSFKDGFTEEDDEASLLQREQHRKAKEEKAKLVALECEKEFNSITEVGGSGYLSKKKIGTLLGCKTRMSSSGTADLIIPLTDIDGKIWNLQKIQESGFKTFMPGGKTEGLFYIIGEIKDVIYITEGFATGASVHLATNRGVVVAFSANNLEKVAKEIRRKFELLPIVIAADDDHSKTPNAGKDAAIKAAASVSGTICSPKFGENRRDQDTDWNDLQLSRGPRELKRQLEDHKATPPSAGFRVSSKDSNRKEPTKEKAKAKEKSRARLTVYEHLKPWINGLSPLPEKYTDKGVLITPSEFEVASELLKYYQGKILKQDEDVFLYVGAHWKLCDQGDLDRLKIQIQVLYAGLAKNSLLESTFNQFIKLVSPTPYDMFKPNPYRTNFLNGTLHVVDTKLLFSPHNPLDYITFVIPIEYDKTRSIKNKEFEAMLDRILGDDEEKESKLRAIKQMYGACVLPISPKIFLLHGLGGRGKSSIIIPAQKLIHESNWCCVEPNEFKGFNMESMVGKLVNIVTDINTREPIDDANIKKIWDRMPVRIDRKFKSVINAPLPAVHVFAGNEIPATYEKSSGAHTRRWVFIEVNRFKIGENYVLDFAGKAFDVCPQGVLNFALEGVEDLLNANMKYHSPQSSIEAVKGWELEHDRIGLFLKEIEEGDVKEIEFGTGRIERKKLWDIFSSWYEESFGIRPRFGRPKFYKNIQGKSFETLKSNGIHFVMRLCDTSLGVPRKDRVEAKF